MPTQLPEEDHLVLLLKHTLAYLTAAITEALTPYGIDGRELAVLRTLANTVPLSQQQLADSLQVDRTTMVALVDSLEAKELVERRPHPDDRRKNVVELTAAGRKVLPRASRTSAAAERRFLAPLDDQSTRQLKATLKAVLANRR